MSVNGFMSGTVSGVGRLRANLAFYAYADKDHMPIRRKYVDFGDGTVGADPEGFYKNRRGCVSIPGGASCATPARSECDGQDAGSGSAECDRSYFSVSKVYKCSAPLLATYPQCPPSGGVYPCQRDNACVYRPRVRVVDNWGQCNGRCPGGAGNGDVCMNEKFASFSSGGECDTPYVPKVEQSGTWRAWTQYAGEIIVRLPK
jgi:hypothetical protein